MSIKNGLLCVSNVIIMQHPENTGWARASVNGATESVLSCGRFSAPDLLNSGLGIQLRSHILSMHGCYDGASAPLKHSEEVPSTFITRSLWRQRHC